MSINSSSYIHLHAHVLCVIILFCIVCMYFSCKIMQWLLVFFLFFEHIEMTTDYCYLLYSDKQCVRDTILFKSPYINYCARIICLDVCILYVCIYVYVCMYFHVKNLQWLLQFSSPFSLSISEMTIHVIVFVIQSKQCVKNIHPFFREFDHIINHRIDACMWVFG